MKGERRGFVAPLLTGNAQENTSDGGASAENRDRRRKETGRVPVVGSINMMMIKGRGMSMDLWKMNKNKPGLG